MRSELLSASVVHMGDTCIVRFRGEVDMSTAPLFESAVSAACTSAAAERETLVVDLTEVTFFGPTGLGLLVTARGRCQALRVPLRLMLSGSAVWTARCGAGCDRAFTMVSAPSPASVSA